MGPIQISTREAIFYWVLINPGFGFVLGLVPLIAGFLKGKIRMGVYGLLASTAGGALLGVFLSIPAMAIFTWLIIRDQIKVEETGVSETDSENN